MTDETINILIRKIDTMQSELNDLKKLLRGKIAQEPIGQQERELVYQACLDWYQPAKLQKVLAYSGNARATFDRLVKCGYIPETYLVRRLSSNKLFRNKGSKIIKNTVLDLLESGRLCRIRSDQAAKAAYGGLCVGIPGKFIESDLNV